MFGLKKKETKITIVEPLKFIGLNGESKAEITINAGYKMATINICYKKFDKTTYTETYIVKSGQTLSLDHSFLIST